MIDIEQEVTRYLREKAAGVEVQPDLPAVMSTRSRRRNRNAGTRRFTALTIVRAAVVLGVIALSVAVIWVGTRKSNRIDDQPSETTTSVPRHPANGIILVSDSIRLTAVDPEGSHRSVPLPVADTGTHGAAWSPDGRRYVYTDGARISIVDLASGATRKIADCPAVRCTFAWSPDGTTIAFTDGLTGIALLDPNGPANQAGTMFGALGGVPSDLNWTPDSQRIIFRISDPHESDIGIESISRDGSDLTTIVARNPRAAWYDYFSLALSPDGSTLAWIGGRPAEGAQDGISALQLMTANVDGSAPKTLRDIGVCACLGFTPGLAWSPDGTQFALALPLPTLSGNGFKLYVADADGSNLRSLGVAGWGTPSWQPIPQG